MILPVRHEDSEVAAFASGEQSPEWRYDGAWLAAAELQKAVSQGLRPVRALISHYMGKQAIHPTFTSRGVKRRCKCQL